MMKTIRFSAEELWSLYVEYGRLVEVAQGAEAQGSPRSDAAVLEAVYEKVKDALFPSRVEMRREAEGRMTSEEERRAREADAALMKVYDLLLRKARERRAAKEAAGDEGEALGGEREDDLIQE
jgi:hypothetical protein